MNAMLQKFCSRLVSLGLNVFAQDKTAKDGWITVHPNGKENKGQHVEIDDETGGVKKGFGGKFKGQKISEIKSKFRGPQVNRLNERPDLKPEPKPMRTPAPQTSAGQKLGGRLQEVLQKRQQEMEKSQPAPEPQKEAKQSNEIRELTPQEMHDRVSRFSHEDIVKREEEIKDRLLEYEKGNIDLSEAELKNLVFENNMLRATIVDPEKVRSWADTDLAILKRKKELRAKEPERRAHQNPESVAGVTRGTPMTLSEADGTSVNPNFKKGGDFTINCQTCVLAYELRCRGYNVEAKPRGSEADGGSGALGNKLAMASASAYIDVETGLFPKQKRIECKDTRKRSTCIKMLNEIDGIMKPGERYAFRLRWPRQRYGHILNLAKDKNGELYLIDSQSGVFATGKEEAYKKYFAKSSNMKDIYIFRTDNTQITQEYQNVLKRASA